MRNFSRRDLFIIGVALISVLIYVLVTRAMVGNLGFPLDDSWIHQTYGRNLAQTGQFEYVPGVRSAGSTSPFYTVLLAIGYALHVPYFVWTYALGAVALALAGLVGARLADRVFPTLRGVGLWTGLALVIAWHLVWAAASGMETMLFGTLSLIVIALACGEIESPNAPSEFMESGSGLPDPYKIQFGVGARQASPADLTKFPPSKAMGGEVNRFGRGAAFGVIGAILIATRPEGILLVGLLVFLMVIVQPQPSPRALVAWIAGALIGGLIGILPYALLNVSLNGTLLPNTFSAKQAEQAPLLAQPIWVNLWAMLQPLTAGGQLFLVPGMVWAAVQLIHQRSRTALLYLILLIWPAALILLYTLRLPAYYQHGRYVIPSLPPLIVLGVGGTLWIVRSSRRTLISRVLARSLATAALLLFVFFWLSGAGYFARDVQMIDAEMIPAAHWLAQNVPPDQLLAVHDIGAVGYFAPRPILDLAGLVSPEVVPIILDPVAIMKLMQQRGTRYLMVLPSQRPAAADDPRLCERFNANGPMGGMTIYELAWDGHCAK
ncbi:MAG: hypothetical protein ABI947_18045 [Chloroflexota bacterium]